MAEKYFLTRVMPYMICFCLTTLYINLLFNFSQSDVLQIGIRMKINYFKQIKIQYKGKNIIKAPITVSSTAIETVKNIVLLVFSAVTYFPIQYNNSLLLLLL